MHFNQSDECSSKWWNVIIMAILFYQSNEFSPKWWIAVKVMILQQIDESDVFSSK